MLLLPEQFYELTWGAYNCRVRGWLRQQEEKWEHTRLLYSILYNVNAKEGHQKSPEELLPLRKDRRNMVLQAAKKPPVDREALIARIKKRDNLT